MQNTDLQTLTDIGLTSLEAHAYVYLLQNAPATAYGVARGIGKPTANTYRAIESLYRRGAPVLEESRQREYRAVTPPELLGAMERQFNEKRDRAAAGLRGIPEIHRDDRVYRLQTPDQVLERMRQMLAGSRHTAVLDLFPWAVAELREAIGTASARGLAVAVKVYEPYELPGALVVLEPGAARVRGRWPGQWINGVVDGQEHLLAWLSEEGRHVEQAVWSGSPFLSWVYHSALVAELRCAAVERVLGQGSDVAAVRSALTAFDAFTSEGIPGYRAVLERKPASEPKL
jgi:sugar-specific transcriptional regulator TrmB